MQKTSQPKSNVPFVTIAEPNGGNHYAVVAGPGGDAGKMCEIGRKGDDVDLVKVKIYDNESDMDNDDEPPNDATLAQLNGNNYHALVPGTNTAQIVGDPDNWVKAFGRIKDSDPVEWVTDDQRFTGRPNPETKTVPPTWP